MTSIKFSIGEPLVMYARAPADLAVIRVSKSSSIVKTTKAQFGF